MCRSECRARFCNRNVGGAFTNLATLAAPLSLCTHDKQRPRKQATGQPAGIEGAVSRQD